MAWKCPRPYGVADDYHSGNIGVLAGKDWDSGSFLAAYQYSENDNITGGERDYRVLDYTPWGGVERALERLRRAERLSLSVLRDALRL